MTKVEVSIVIRRSPEDVFAYISNFENNAIWQDGVESATLTSGGPLRVGSTYTQISRFLGRRIEFHFEVTEYEPNRLVKFTTVTGSFPVQIARGVEPHPDGSRVTALIKGDAGGFFRLLSPLLDWMTHRSIKADYAQLKQVLEAEHNSQ